MVAVAVSSARPARAYRLCEGGAGRCVRRPVRATDVLPARRRRCDGAPAGRRASPSANDGSSRVSPSTC